MNQDKLADGDPFTGLQAIEIDAGGDRFRIIAAAVPRHRVRPGRLGVMNKSADGLPEKVEDLQLDRCGFRNLVADGGLWIEGIGEVGLKDKLSRTWG